LNRTVLNSKHLVNDADSVGVNLGDGEVEMESNLEVYLDFDRKRKEKMVNNPVGDVCTEEKREGSEVEKQYEGQVGNGDVELSKKGKDIGKLEEWRGKANKWGKHPGKMV
jgi:hypothetical protein